jgi:serine/threonine-protein kinase
MTPAPLGADRVVDDRYVLEALIGRGGMGEVWRARHVTLRSAVAIKFLRGSSDPSERARRRFLTEAQVTANLNTRHAVQVFDFGVTEDGLPYLVMELLDGETLDERIERLGRLSIADTARILQKAARALERAHALGIVHRDFKPENVMLVPDEEEGELVKVVDFGIAKLVGDLDHTLKCALGSIAQAMRPRSSPALDVTTGGVGTPQYMAPEQVQDAPHVGPAADIWAFGVVAYECLTGYRPFEDESVGKLLMRVLAADPPRASKIAPGVPALFDEWFRVACARLPADRFPDIQTAASALATALGTAENEARPSPPPEAVVSDPRAGASVPQTLESATSAADPESSLAESPLSASPLASTLGSTPPPAGEAPEAEIEASPAELEPPPPAAPAPRSVRLPAPAPRVSRLTRSAIGAALLVAALAAMLAFRREPRAPREAAAQPIAMANTRSDARRPRAVEEPAPVDPPEPASTTAQPEPEPPAPASAAPTTPPVRRKGATPRALPSAYRLPPLGL